MSVLGFRSFRSKFKLHQKLFLLYNCTFLPFLSTFCQSESHVSSGCFQNSFFFLFLFSKCKSVINTVCHLCIFYIIVFYFQKRFRILDHNSSNGKCLKRLMKMNFIRGQHLFGFMICDRWFLNHHFTECHTPYICFQIQCD